MKLLHRFFPSLLLLIVLSGPTQAANCNFKVDGFGVIPDRTVLGVLRCLVRELDEVKQENAALKARIEDLEALSRRLPAAFTNEDGVISEEEGRAIGRANFILSARSTGGANAMPVEQRVLDEVCGKSGGCAVSVAFRQISLFDAEVKENVLTGPCQLTYEPGDGQWSLGAGCGDGPKSGTDGDQSAQGSDAADPVLVQSGGGCLLSEAEPAWSVGQDDSFARDYDQGLFLVAMPARQPDGIRRFQCELILN